MRRRHVHRRLRHFLLFALAVALLFTTTPLAVGLPPSPQPQPVAAELGDDLQVPSPLELPGPLGSQGYATLGASALKENPYSHDPWVAYLPITLAPAGTHVWEVWACNSPYAGPPIMTTAQFVSKFNGPVADWFTKVSRGRYKPQLIAKGSFTPEASCWSGSPQPTGDRGLIAIRGGCCGVGGPGEWSIGKAEVELKEGRRRAEIGTDAMRPPDWPPCPQCEFDTILDILIHEMGHALGWPHVPAAEWSLDEPSDYDNLADIMSGASVETGVVPPTAAFNLYTSGWIDSSEIQVWDQNPASFRLGTPMSSRTKMLMIPSGIQGRFHTISVTPTSGTSADPRGVLVHRVDQSASSKDGQDLNGESGYCAADQACFLVSRVTEAIVPSNATTDDYWGRVDPVFMKGDTLKIGAWTMEVTAIHTDGFTVRMAGKGGPPPPKPPRFQDVPTTHTFVDAIERLAEAGITRGCNPNQSNTRFCPNDHVTRGQMAAFLVRALGLPAYTGPDRFTDDDDNIFEDAIERLAEAGITKGCNPPDNTRFCPADRMTRGQMAAFLVRALGLPAYTGPDRFTDDDDNIFEDAIERLAEAGITKGCNPPANTRFCPDDRVTRGQMAAFIVRAGLAD